MNKVLKKQKFRRGDLVRVAKDLGPMMAHFQSDCNAIVIASYAEKYGGDDTHQYTIFVEGSGETSWYYEHQLTFIRHAPDLLEIWKDQEDAARRDAADILWIKAHWEELKSSISATSILTLFDTIGFKSQFLANGEYYCLFSEWEEAMPFFDLIMTAEKVEDVLKHSAVAGHDLIKSVWSKVHPF